MRRRWRKDSNSNPYSQWLVSVNAKVGEKSWERRNQTRRGSGASLPRAVAASQYERGREGLAGSRGVKGRVTGGPEVRGCGAEVG